MNLISIFVKILVAIFVAGLIWFLFRPGLVSDWGAGFLIVILWAVIAFSGKIDFSVIFRREREILSLEEWRPKAVADLIANHPEDFDLYGIGSFPGDHSYNCFDWHNCFCRCHPHGRRYYMGF